MTKSQLISDDILKQLQDKARQDGCSVDELIHKLLDQTNETSSYLTVALDNVADAIIATNIKLAITAWNKGAELIYGWTEAEAIGKTVDILLKTDWINEDQAEAQSKLLQTGHWGGEIEQVHRDGYRLSIWAVVSFIFDNDNEIVGAVTVNRDITKNKITREALRASEKRLKTLYSAIPDLIFRNRFDGTYLDYHALDSTELYVDPSEFMGRTVSEVLPESFANEVMPVIQQVIKTGEATVYEYELESHYFEMRVVKSGSDEVLSMIRDITDSRLAQKRELEIALERERLELLTAFIRNTAHEFRTPLSTIATNAYLISRYDESEMLAQKTQQIDVQVNRISKLIDMSLMIAKLEAPTQPYLKINIYELFKGVCLNMLEQYGDTPQLICEKPSDSPEVIGNAEYLADAFRHLMDNAYHFTPPDGSITVKSNVVDNQIMITISDTGLGISREDMSHVFETFWRKDIAHTTPGFGLGLSIAKKIIEQHNGHIEIESELGQGTDALIILPLV